VYPGGAATAQRTTAPSGTAASTAAAPRGFAATATSRGSAVSATGVDSVVPAASRGSAASSAAPVPVTGCLARRGLGRYARSAGGVQSAAGAKAYYPMCAEAWVKAPPRSE
jgi:hypothetical protein